MPNQFYVDPTLGRRQGDLAGLGAIVRENRAAKEAAATKQQMQTDITAAVNSGEPSQMAEMAIKYPDMQEAAMTAFGFTNPNSERFAREAYKRALTDPDNAEMYLQQGIDAVSKAGGSPENMTAELQMLQKNRPAALQAMRMGYATIDPEGSDIYESFQAGDAELEQGTGLMQGWSYNNKTGEYTIQPEIQAMLAAEATELSEKDMLTAKDVAGINDKVTTLVAPARDIRQAAVDLDNLSINATPSDQIAAVFKFMKALDPTSAVRENEVGMIEGAEGTLKGIANMYNRMIGEGGISETGFNQIVNTSKQLANSAVKSNIDEVAKYTDVISDNMTPKQLEKLNARVPGMFDITTTADTPAGMTDNGDGTFTLPDGRIVRRTGG